MRSAPLGRNAPAVFTSAPGANFGGDPVDERPHHSGVGRVGHLAPGTVGEFTQPTLVPVGRHHRQAAGGEGTAVA